VLGTTALSRAAVAALVAVMFALGLAACGSDEGSDSGGAKASKPAPKVNPDLKGKVSVGAVLPTTGDSASIGEDQTRGAKLAVEKVNSGQGVLGKQLAVNVEDSQSDTVAGVQAARKLVSVNHVPVVVSEFISARTLAVGKYLQKAGVVHINPGSSSTDITKIGDFSFSSIGLDDIAGEFAAKKLYDAGYRKIAFLGPNNPYGAQFARVVKSTFEKLGGQVTESILYSEGESTYRPELERLKDSDPELYVYASYVPDTKTINQEAFELGLDPKTFYGIYLSICVEDVDPKATEGQQGQDLTFTGPAGREFSQAYQSRFGEKPRTPYSAYVYDAVLMAAKAMDKAGSAKPDAIRKALAQVGRDYPGATGSITLDKDGQREAQAYALLKVDAKGKLQETKELAGPEK
jgi:branched-chain amino acid transport system substrate-binding protein